MKADNGFTERERIETEGLMWISYLVIIFADISLLPLRKILSHYDNHYGEYSQTHMTDDLRS